MSYYTMEEVLDELQPTDDAVAIEISGPTDEVDPTGDLRLVWCVRPVDEAGGDAGETKVFFSYRAALRFARAAAKLLALDVDDTSWPAE